MTSLNVDKPIVNQAALRQSSAAQDAFVSISQRVPDLVHSP